MKERFQGPEGYRKLIGALRESWLVEHSDDLARRLAERGELVEFLETQTIIQQDNCDDDVYFIVAGEASVAVNGRIVAIRYSRESIGEMALLEPVSTRSASVFARTTVVAVKVTEPVFNEIAEEFPKIWKPIARVVAERLRERAQFHRPPNALPAIFIGCSIESLEIARNIQMELQHDNCDIRIWNQGIFGPTGVTVDGLIKQVKQVDFAVFVFAPDDKVTNVKRGTDSDAPRDNVIFEMGMFISELNRERTFLIKERGTDIKIPSDLLGLTAITYQISDPTNLAAALGPACTEIRNSIKRLGCR